MATPNIPLGHTDYTTGSEYPTGSGLRYGGVATDTKKNWFVSVMQNKVVQVAILESIKENHKYAPYFDDTHTRTYGRAIEYLLPQLKDGLIATKELSVHKGTDFKRENEMAYVRLLKIMDHLYYDVIVEERLLECLTNEELIDDLVDAIKRGIGKKIKNDLAKAVEAIITDEDKYKKATWDNTAKAGQDATSKKIDGNLLVLPATEKKKLSEVDGMIKLLWNVSSAFLSENDTFQKGWDATPEGGTRNGTKILTNSENTQSIHLIIDYDADDTLTLGQSKDYYNQQLADIRKRFGRVTATKLPNNFIWFMFDEEALKIKLKAKFEDRGLEHKYEPENSCNGFFAKPIAHGGIITCLNYAALQLGS